MIDPLRALVVGASSGVGRAVSLALAQAHHAVVAMARRADRLEQLCDETPGSISAVIGDVRDETSCRAAVDVAMATLGGIDALVYCSGVSQLDLVRDTSFEEFQRIFETNVIGAGRMFALCHSELSTNGGQMLVVSSLSEQRPKPGLVPYGASKAALRKLIEGLRSENPEIAFTNVSIGPTAGTEFAEHFDRTTMRTMFAAWTAGGYLAPGQMAVEDVAHRIVECLVSPVRTDDLVLLPRP